MAPFFLDKLSPKPPIDGDQDQNSSLSPLTTLSADDHASSLSFPFLFSTPQYQGFTQMDHHFQPPPPPPLHQEPLNLLLIGGSSDQQQRSSLIQTANNENIVDHHGDDLLPGSSKWMSNSKIRIMRKTMISSGDDRMHMTKPQRNFQVLQDQHPNLGATSASGGITVDGSSPNGFVRVCSECKTTKTPLWRGGPRGPKSLCNACGIRQMKARRAMAASTATNANDVGVAPKVRKDKRSYNMDRSTLPFKKRCKITISETTKKKLRFDDVAVSLSKDSDFHRVFPQDEREAAILLMGLSCGLIQG